MAVPIPTKSCRTCCHATPVIEDAERGAWSCEKNCPNIATGEGCAKHLLIPGMLTFADPCDSGEDWIEFQNHKDGAHWRHGDGTEGTWSTEELMLTPGPLVGAKAVQAVKTTFAGTVEAVETLSLIDRYPPEDSRLLWDGPADDIESGIEAAHILELATGKPTEEQDNDAVSAYEYDGRYLIVIYKADNYAAIWEGKE